MELLLKYYPFAPAAVTLFSMLGFWAWQKYKECEHTDNSSGVHAGADLSGGKRAVSTLQD